MRTGASEKRDGDFMGLRGRYNVWTGGEHTRMAFVLSEDIGGLKAQADFGAESQDEADGFGKEVREVVPTTQETTR